MNDETVTAAIMLGCTGVILAAIGGGVSETEMLHIALLLLVGSIVVVGVSFVRGLRAAFGSHTDPDTP